MVYLMSPGPDNLKLIVLVVLNGRYVGHKKGQKWFSCISWIWTFVVMKCLLFIGRVFTIAVGIAFECMLYIVRNEGHSLFMYSQRVI